MAIAIAGVKRLTNSAPLPPDTAKVFVDQVFNAGTGAFAASTMRRKILAHDFNGACREFPRWDKITVPEGGKKDMRDGTKDGHADCKIRANDCYGLVTRREDQMHDCLKGLQ